MVVAETDPTVAKVAATAVVVTSGSIVASSSSSKPDPDSKSSMVDTGCDFVEDGVDVDNGELERATVVILMAVDVVVVVRTGVVVETVLLILETAHFSRFLFQPHPFWDLHNFLLVKTLQPSGTRGSCVLGAFVAIPAVLDARVVVLLLLADGGFVVLEASMHIS